MNNGEFITAAQSSVWIYAKTMPDCPHEYIIRGKTANDETYFAMFKTIEERADWGEYAGTQYQYLHPDDGYYYWKMTGDMSESIIINRAKEESEIRYKAETQMEGKP